MPHSKKQHGGGHRYNITSPWESDGDFFKRHPLAPYLLRPTQTQELPKDATYPLGQTLVIRLGNKSRLKMGVSLEFSDTDAIAFIAGVLGGQA